MDIEIKAPKGYKLVESVKDNVKHISFIPEEIIEPKTAMRCWEEVVKNYLKGNHGFFYDTEDNKITSTFLSTPIPERMLETHLTKERAEAFLYLQALVTARDYYNEGWIADWTYKTEKFVINTRSNKITTVCYNSLQHILNFKTPEIRDKFYEDFKEWIELCKNLI